MRGEHVVDELVVALADLVADGEEVGVARPGCLDLREALLLVGHDVHAREPLERVRVDDVGRAVPVVADVEHVARRRRRRRGGRGDEEKETQNPERWAHAQSMAYGKASARRWKERIRGFSITPSRISIARSDRLVRVPGRGPGHHDRQVLEQRLAVLPRRRVPQERRAVVDGVVVQAVADVEHRVGERRRARPLEPHALVAGDVDEQRSRARSGRGRRSSRRSAGCRCPGGCS